MIMAIEIGPTLSQLGWGILAATVIVAVMKLFASR